MISYFTTNNEDKIPEISVEFRQKLNKDNSLLHYAASTKSKRIILNLLMNGIDPYVSNKKGQTPMDLHSEINTFIESVYKVDFRSYMSIMIFS